MSMLLVQWKNHNPSYPKYIGSSIFGKLYFFDIGNTIGAFGWLVLNLIFSYQKCILKVIKSVHAIGPVEIS
jgi:hypothetical protein